MTPAKGNDEEKHVSIDNLQSTAAVTALGSSLSDDDGLQEASIHSHSVHSVDCFSKPSMLKKPKNDSNSKASSYPQEKQDSLTAHSTFDDGASQSTSVVNLNSSFSFHTHDLPYRQSRVKFQDNSDSSSPATNNKNDKTENGNCYNKVTSSRRMTFVRGSMLRPKQEDMIVTDTSTDEATLSEDIYSFIYISDYRSSVFVFAIAVFLFQMSIILLTLTSLINPKTSNPLNIPPSVSAEVKVTGILSVILAASTQNDVLMSMVKLHHGYSRYDNAMRRLVLFNPRSSSLKEIAPSPSCLKWFLSCCLQFCAGCGLLVILFILIIQSDTIIGMMLNFAALNFMSEIDDVGFYLCKRGFVTNKLQRAALHVNDYKIKISKYSNTFRRGFFLLVLAGLMSGYVVVSIHQRIGKYLCNTIFVQFDSDFLPELGAFTGLYTLSIETPIRDRSNLKYRSEKVPDHAFFSYCKEGQYWTFVRSSANNNTGHDSCDWVARSSETRSYDLLDAIDGNWHVRDVRRKPVREAILTTIYVFCIDCNPSSCGSIEGRGICNEVTSKCDCKPEYYGESCQFNAETDICKKVAVDTRKEGFVGNREFANEFVCHHTPYNDTAVQHLPTVYRLPVYVSDMYNGVRDVLMFIGRHWVLTSTSMLYDFHDPKNQSSLSFLLTYLETEFHAHYSNYEVVFVSSEVSYDSDFTEATPVGLVWYGASPKRGSIVSVQPRDETKPLETVLMCTICNDETNPCFFDGQCLSDGTCDCANECEGTLCQIPPLGDGHCDSFFNNANFGFDHGDCCEATCYSTPFHTCGFDEIEASGLMYIGYEDCIEPQRICGGVMETCWRPNSESILGTTLSGEFGASVVLSANGKVLAVGEPGDDSVYVYEKSGAVWLEKGSRLKGNQEGSHFGASIAMTADGNIIVVGAPNYFSSISSVDDHDEAFSKEQGQLIVFEYTSEVWTVVDQMDGASMAADSLGSCTALSEDGNVLSVALSCDNSIHDGNSLVLAWMRIGDSFFMKDAMTIINTTSGGVESLPQGTSLSMSGHGNIVAVGSTVANMFSSNRTKAIVEVYRSISNDNKVLYERIGGPILGCCGVISKNGLVLAVSVQIADGVQIVHSYYWDRISSAWKGRNATLKGKPLDLSYDGSVMVVCDHRSTIRTYHWTSFRWKELGEEIQGGSDVSVSLSNVGYSGISSMAVGIPYKSQEKHGETNTYQLLNPPSDVFSCDSPGSALFRLSITFDKFPKETTWELLGFNSTISSGQYGNEFRYETTTTEECLPKDSCLQFTIHDHNGICCTQGVGGYTVSFDGDVVKIGAQFNQSESFRFGGRNC